MAATKKVLEKTRLVEQIGALLDVAGIGVTWEEIGRELRARIPVRCLRGLRYRIERARSESYENGERNAREAGDPGERYSASE